MVGFGPVRHDRLRIEVGSTQHGAGLGGERKERILHVGRSEDVGVDEDVLDVFHSGDHHVPELVGIEDRMLVAQRPGDGIRIGEIVGVER